MTYTLTHSPDGDYEIVTDEGRWVAFTLADALALLIDIGVTLHPEHASIANALGVAS